MKKDNSANFKQSTVLPWIEMRIASPKHRLLCSAFS